MSARIPTKRSGGGGGGGGASNGGNFWNALAGLPAFDPSDWVVYGDDEHTLSADPRGGLQLDLIQELNPTHCALARASDADGGYTFALAKGARGSLNAWIGGWAGDELGAGKGLRFNGTGGSLDKFGGNDWTNAYAAENSTLATGITDLQDGPMWVRFVFSLGAEYWLISRDGFSWTLVATLARVRPPLVGMAILRNVPSLSSLLGFVYDPTLDISTMYDPIGAAP